jgi:hypothetical protein
MAKRKTDKAGKGDKTPPAEKPAAAPAETYTPPLGPNHRVVLFSGPFGKERQTIDLYGCGEACEMAFADELAMMDRPVRTFTRDTFAAICPFEFFHMPAAAGGNYHPRRFGRPGGLVLHTRLVVWWALRLADSETEECYRQPGIYRDELVAACLLHDLCKFRPVVAPMNDPPAPPWGKLPHYSRSHGQWAARAIRHLWGTVRPLPVEPNTIRRIVLAVWNHMGRWSDRWEPATPAEVPPMGMELARLVHLADYAAAQRVDDELSSLVGDGHRGTGSSAACSGGEGGER